ncbi:MAG: restriction endonuclease subunit S [Candidatus Thiodiazotropha sp. (ex Lucinoma kastoroae)]|nr:restriction endonuclease subunit S [Candidatus Thiodiazotropha sp. (ex Lucinoma kastoroae)]
MIGDWKQGRIKDLIDSLESGVSVNGEDRVPAEDEYAVLKVSAVTYDVFDSRAAKPILDGEIARAKCNPKAGQILISRASGTANHVGACVYVDRDYPNRYLPDKLWQTVPKAHGRVNNKWLFYVLSSAKIKSGILNRATGTNIKNITKEELLSLAITIPQFPEQTAIANLLSTWDEAIEKTERLIQAKERQFRCVVEELIYKSVKYGIWDEVHAGSLFKERKETHRDDLPLLSITNDQGVIPREETNRKDTSNEDKSKYRRIFPGDLGYNTMRMWQGVSALAECEGIVSPAYTVCIPGEKLIPEFVAFLFKTPFMIHRFYRYSQGLTPDTWNLKFRHFSEVKVPLPSIDEQRKITEVLSVAQQEIDLLKQLAEKYKTQKRGLMQKLLMGIWRVRTDKEVA